MLISRRQILIYTLFLSLVLKLPQTIQASDDIFLPITTPISDIVIILPSKTPTPTPTRIPAPIVTSCTYRTNFYSGATMGGSADTCYMQYTFTISGQPGISAMPYRLYSHTAPFPDQYPNASLMYFFWPESLWGDLSRVTGNILGHIIKGYPPNSSTYVNQKPYSISYPGHTLILSKPCSQLWPNDLRTIGDPPFYAQTSHEYYSTTVPLSNWTGNFSNVYRCSLSNCNCSEWKLTTDTTRICASDRLFKIRTCPNNCAKEMGCF